MVSDTHAVKRCDVLVENFIPGAAEKLCIGYDREAPLSTRNMLTSSTDSCHVSVTPAFCRLIRFPFLFCMVLASQR